MRIERRFSKTSAGAWGGVGFSTRAITLFDPSGEISFSHDAVEVPEGWSQAAAELLACRFFCREGVAVALRPVAEPGVPAFLWRSEPDPEALAQLPPSARYMGETSARQVFDRLAGSWTYHGWKAGLFADEISAQNFLEESRAMLARQIAAPGARQWALEGLFWAYGIASGGLGYATDPAGGAIIAAGPGQPVLAQSLIALSPGEGTLPAARGLALSADLSTDPDPLSVLQGSGRARRQAPHQRARRQLLLSCAIEHAAAPGLIGWKMREEHKAASLIAGSRAIEAGLNGVLAAIAEGGSADPGANPALCTAIRAARAACIPESLIARSLDYGAQGYASLSLPLWEEEWDSAVWDQVAGRDVSLGLRLSDAFMAARREGGEAAQLWQEIGEAAWACGDQSLFFTDSAAATHCCPGAGPILVPSPMGEHLFAPGTAPLQGVLNLTAFLREGRFDCEAFAHAARIWVIMLEIATATAALPEAEEARRMRDYRPLALGYTGLAALLMRLGLAWESEAARAFTATLTAALTGAGLEASAEMAALCGAFAGYEAGRETMLEVLTRQSERLAPGSSFSRHAPDPALLAAARAHWARALELGAAQGFRHAQISQLGPCGALSLLMDCETNGIEPESAQVKYYARPGRPARPGLNPSVAMGLAALGYSESQILAIRAWALGCQSLADAPGVNHKALMRLGFGPDELGRIEAALPGAFDLRFVFTPWVLGESFCLDHLAVPPRALHDPGFDLLRHLGFSPEDIAAASGHVCGHHRISGAPGLRAADLPVFACARDLAAESQIRMMAAAQAFLSGGIGRIVTLPHEARIADVLALYDLAWRLGLKTISLYREGSKLSHPLARDLLAGMISEPASATGPASPSSAGQVQDQARHLAARLGQLVSAQPPQGPQPGAGPLRGQRESLPARRKGYTRKARIGGHKIWLRSGEYADGRPGEIFLTTGAEGEALRAMMNHFAIAISTGLQYGVPLEEFVEAFTRAPALSQRLQGSGEGAGGGAGEAGAILDFIFRDLAVTYLDRSDLSPDQAGPGLSARGAAGAGEAGNQGPLPGEGLAPGPEGALGLLRAIAASASLRPGAGSGPGTGSAG